MSKYAPTGNHRFRVYKPWFSKPVMILQVEIKTDIISCDGGRIDSREITTWVDARPEHLLTFIEE